MPDIGIKSFDRFICLERGAAFDDEIRIAAGSSHITWMTLERVDEIRREST